MALDQKQSPAGFESNRDPIYDRESEKISKNGSGDLEGHGRRHFEHHGGRIGPVLKHLRGTTTTDGAGSDSEANILAGQIEAESENAIQYRTCSWQKTAALLFSEYICLAIMSFPYSYSVLGLVPGLILTVVIAAFVLYTSLVVWEFCLRHPEVRDVCDIGQMLFWGKTWAWYATAVMFILNNTFIQGLHVLVFAKYLNTITDHSQCTIVFAVVAAIICWLASLPRTFSALANLATASAFFTFISVLLAAIFAGIEAHPAGYNPDPNFINPKTGIHGGEPIVTAIPVAGTTFVSGMSAFLNISYTFIGQITIPSFIAEMREPKDFPKALWAVTIAEVLVFGIIGSVVYAYTGNQYNTAPAFGSLGNETFKKVSFSFMIPTLIFLGVLYASVSARFVFFRIFEGTKHKSSHTVVGWASWAGILAATWVGAFLIAEVIPFFSDLLSVMSSLFDSFFGFIFWGLAYVRMRRVDGGVTWLSDMSIYGYSMLALNLFIIAIGLFFLSAGTYASVQSIINSYDAGTVGGVFTCASNGL
ncbi:N amino acid transport system protein [Lachnellula willkommii]|uniref:N amino acid transport system protein n=1 Tax=Lachnellula willkommii TaxID=215461 RepID=A0A559M0Z0_9HELO|nr:N amino acid transport system protein [Lachnellula willkommii]